MSYYVDKGANAGVKFSNYTYKTLAEMSYNRFINFRVILLGESINSATECICRFSTYDPTDLSKVCNIAKYEINNDANYLGNPTTCVNGSAYPIGGFTVSNVRLYSNDQICLHGIVSDNIKVINDPVNPYNFRYYGVAVVAMDSISGIMHPIYIDVYGSYKTVYKNDVSISFETVAGVNENFIMSFFDQPQFE